MSSAFHVVPSTDDARDLLSMVHAIVFQNAPTSAIRALAFEANTISVHPSVNRV
jgi:hypothetical protein